MISVIIPTYNNAHFITRALDSVCEQTYTNFEIIVVDDGSTDNTRDVVLAYQDSRITYVYQQNAGLSATRNVGLKHACGKFIYFLDSDDWIASNYFELMYEAANKYAADIVLSTIVITDEVTQTIRTPYITRPTDINVRNYYDPIYFHPIMQNKLIRKVCIDNVSESGLQFPEGLHYEDVYFFTRLYMAVDTVVLCEEAQFYYYQHANSIMKKATMKLCDIEVIMTQLMKEVPELQDELWFEYMVVRHLYLASTLRAIKGKSFSLFYKVTRSHRKYIHKLFPMWKQNPLLRTSKMYESRGQYYYVMVMRKLGYTYTKYIAYVLARIGVLR